MGRVLLARDLAQNEHALALKILLPEYRHSTSGFLKEFVTQRHLRHPNIPAVYELGFSQHPRGGEVPYFTQEYCRGVPLIMAIPRVKRLAEMWPWMIQILRALDYMHRWGWIHRDLKPGNVLVDMKDTSDTSTRLIDLGVASRIGAPPEKVFIGTPEYCAPEILAGRRFDQRSDLYAFGLVLYEAIERRRPWTGSNEVELLTGRLKKPPPPIAHPDCPPEVEELVKHLLRPRPKERPKTAAEVLERLARAVGLEMAIETPLAFRRQLSSIPMPGRDEILEQGEKCLSGILPGREEQGQARVMLVEDPPGFDGAWLVHELADRAAVQGARVVRVAPHLPVEQSLGGLEPAIEVFRRLREAAGEDASALRGAAGAAAMLTRLHAPTVLVVDNIQRFDTASLSVLQAVFTGSRADNLRVLATRNPSEKPASAEAFANFMTSTFVLMHKLEPLSLEQSATWLESAVGAGTLELPAITQIHGESGGSPAGLRATTQKVFEDGELVRVGASYGLKGAAPLTKRSAAKIAAAEIPREDQRLACLRNPLPEEVLERFLKGSSVTSLISNGTLVRRPDDLLEIADGAQREATYRNIATMDKMRHHRRLARIMHQSTAFPNQRALVAQELVHSDKPILATPHLVVAASEAVGVDSAAKAREFLDRAADLLKSQATPDEAVDTWRWWIMLWKARVRLAMTEGDLDALDESTGALVQLGTDAAHVPTLQFALETRMVSAQERGDWDRLLEHAVARLRLDGPEPSPDAIGLHRWAQALSFWSKGETPEALESIEEGLSLKPERPRPGVWLRLAALKAHILIDQRTMARAEQAMAELGEAAVQGDDLALTIQARILESQVSRFKGRPEEALMLLKEVAGEMPPEHVRTAACHLELELARAHLDFGWITSAEDHVAQARELAKRDGDVSNEARAMLLEAEVALWSGDATHARFVAASAVEMLAGKNDWRLSADVELMRIAIELKIESGPDRTMIARAQQLAQVATQRHDAPRAAVASRLGALLALRNRDPALAVELAEGALRQSDECRGWRDQTAAFLYVLAVSRHKAGIHRTAQALETRALEHVRQIAATIEDRGRKKAWVNAPINQEILKLVER
ncbi:MAG: hypothetical protein CL940_05415 [Deltaproteobacteria bacterium]|nr:hypothetical protein [Deltaproteobacteria bacterium]